MTADAISQYFELIIEDAKLIIPYALAVFASLWGLRIAIDFFKSVAR